MSDTVAFDPGIGELCKDFYAEVYTIENDLANMPLYPRKARYYNVAYKVIFKAFLNNLAFYKGCLAWAYYIVNTHKDAKITGNKFLNYTEEQKAQYGPTDFIDFFMEYFEKYQSDLKYYHIKNVTFPEGAKETMEMYRNFVSANEGFINTAEVKDILLPENLSFKASLDEIKQTIDSAVEEKNLNKILEL